MTTETTTHKAPAIEATHKPAAAPRKNNTAHNENLPKGNVMETQETLVVVNPNTQEIIKEAAIKAAAGALVAVVVTQAATFVMNKAAVKIRERKVKKALADQK